MSVEEGYPVVMTHPHNRPAVVAVGDAMGQAEKFPKVTVNNIAQEIQHRALGYVRFGEAAPGFVDYYEYPKFMRHPEHRDEEWIWTDTFDGNGNRVGATKQFASGKFPDVVATDAESEAKWREKGFKPAGEYNQSALDSALHGLPDIEIYKPKQYPRWEIAVDDEGKQIIEDDGRPKLVLVEKDPNEKVIEPTSEFPKLVDNKLVLDPRLPPPVDPKLYPMWVHKNNKPSDESQLAKNPQEEAEIRLKWKKAESEIKAEVETDIEVDVPKSIFSPSLNKRNRSPAA